MSSTKRGAQRGEHDNYPTPTWCWHRLFDAMPELREGGHWLEPAAGDGALVVATETYVPKKQLYNPPKLTLVELRGECAPMLQLSRATGRVRRVVCPQNYFTWDTKAKFDVVITNPPFRLAMNFIERSLALTQRFAIMLLRLNYVGSKVRHGFMSTNMAHRIYVLPNRPPFTRNKQGKWGTDSIEYAWFVWDKLLPKTDTAQLKMLALTPKEERRPS